MNTGGEDSWCPVMIIRGKELVSLRTFLLVNEGRRASSGVHHLWLVDLPNTKVVTVPGASSIYYSEMHFTDVVLTQTW